jgi:tRNA 2-thiocytidine biosynthesis protein TtcA
VIEVVDAPATEEDQTLARLYADAPRSLAFRKLRKRLLRETQEAIARYAMAPKPHSSARWLVCLSGGKDSYTLLTLLLDLKWQGALAGVEFLACNLDQGQPGFPKHVLPDYLGRLGAPFRIETRDTYQIVKEKTPEGATYCALCSRLRRGNLYRIAREEGCAAVVLGHHADDALETLFLNLFYGGKLAALAPKLLNDEGDLLVLRPLLLCAEADIARFAAAMAYPIIPCDLCGSQDGLQRAAMKRMIAEWERVTPGRRARLLAALQSIRPEHLMDAGAFDFSALAQRRAD